MATPASFQELQSGFYNAFLTGMGFNNGDPVQLLQPSNPLISGASADALLWQYFNFLPPELATASFILSPGNQFLSNYQGVMSALLAQPNNFQKVVGDQCFAAWQQAIQSGAVTLGNDPGGAFRNWAMFHSLCSRVAVSGASAYTAAMLDPVYAAQQNVMPYKPAGTKDVNFIPGYTEMTQLLALAPSRSFSVAQGGWNTSLTTQWSKSHTSALFGLWGSSSSESSLSHKFAVSGVSLSADFQHVLQFAPSPGFWYSSAAFGSAFNNPNKDPWVSGNPINWDTTFGSAGNMQRYAVNAIIVSGMNVTVTSVAIFSGAEQKEINDNQGSGLWPFYSTSSSSGVFTSANFNDVGNMTVTITSAVDVPIVVALWVLPASQYLGHLK